MKSQGMIIILILVFGITTDMCRGNPGKKHQQQREILKHQQYHHRRRPNEFRKTNGVLNFYRHSDYISKVGLFGQEDDKSSPLFDSVSMNYPIQRNCSSCVNRELFKNFTKEEIKDKILRKLGFNSPPNITTEAVPLHLIRQLLTKYHKELSSVQNDQTENDPGDDFHFQTKQINVMANTDFDDSLGTIPESILQQNWKIQHFHLNTKQLKDSWRDVVKARLWVHLPEAPKIEDTYAWVNVYYVSVDKHGHAFLTQEAATKVKLRPDRGGWIEIDVWDMISLWFKNMELNFGLVIRATTSTGEQISVGIQDQPYSTPFLQLDIRETVGLGRRNKRNLHKVCSEETDAAETHCCLWPITIDFEEEFGWKWIIHPPKYQANYCAGDCSLGVMMPSNPYSHLLQQANGNPCCAPQKMSGMNMLYLDENKNVILGKLPNMRVDRCGCI